MTPAKSEQPQPSDQPDDSTETPEPQVVEVQQGDEMVTFTDGVETSRRSLDLGGDDTPAPVADPNPANPDDVPPAHG